MTTKTRLDLDQLSNPETPQKLLQTEFKRLKQDILQRRPDRHPSYAKIVRLAKNANAGLKTLIECFPLAPAAVIFNPAMAFAISEDPALPSRLWESLFNQSAAPWHEDEGRALEKVLQNGDLPIFWPLTLVRAATPSHMRYDWALSVIRAAMAHPKISTLPFDETLIAGYGAIIANAADDCTGLIDSNAVLHDQIPDEKNILGAKDILRSHSSNHDKDSRVTTRRCNALAILAIAKHQEIGIEGYPFYTPDHEEFHPTPYITTASLEYTDRTQAEVAAEAPGSNLVLRPYFNFALGLATLLLRDPTIDYFPKLEAVVQLFRWLDIPVLQRFLEAFLDTQDFSAEFSLKESQILLDLAKKTKVKSLMRDANDHLLEAQKAALREGLNNLPYIPRDMDNISAVTLTTNDEDEDHRPLYKTFIFTQTEWNEVGSSFRWEVPPEQIGAMIHYLENVSEATDLEDFWKLLDHYGTKTTLSPD